MVRAETIFNAADSLTPEFAARLSDCASRFQSTVWLDCGGKQLRLDSLIGILALDLYRGVRVGVLAKGEDAQMAVEAIREIVETEA